MANDQAQGGAAVAAPGRKAIWAGWIMGAIPVLFMVMSSIMKLSRNAQVVEGWSKSGYPMGTLLPIGVVEICCAAIYVFPRTAVLGAILVTGFLGGATATHVHAGEAIFVVPVLLGMMAWGGIFLRDPRLRLLLPLRRRE